MRRKESLLLQKDVVMYANEKAIQPKSKKTTTCRGTSSNQVASPGQEKTMLKYEGYNPDLSFLNVDWKKTQYGQ